MSKVKTTGGQIESMMGKAFVNIEHTDHGPGVGVVALWGMIGDEGVYIAQMSSFSWKLIKPADDAWMKEYIEDNKMHMMALWKLTRNGMEEVDLS